MQRLKDTIQDHITNLVSDTSSPLAPARIPRVPRLLTHDYDKYFVPKVVSIGPYHYGEEKLELVEKLKPVFAMKLVENKQKYLDRLLRKLEEPDMVRDLRSYYEENSITKFSNKDFAKMMLLDCCFILYYCSFSRHDGYWEELNIRQYAFIHQDLFLLENQVPFKAIMEGIKVFKMEHFNDKLFIYENILAWGKLERNKFEVGSFIDERRLVFDGDNLPDHLLHLLHRTLTKNVEVHNRVQYSYLTRNDSDHKMRNARELVRVGIRFKPSDGMSFTHIHFVKGGWCVSPTVELPPIIVDGSTKPMFLNLIAYEMCSNDDKAWVTSYVCFLKSLIAGPEDVEVLRNARVLENLLGSDSEVAKLFEEMGTDLVPGFLAYDNVKNNLLYHYEHRSNKLNYQLKLLSLFGGTSIVLSAVQTYFTIWSLKSECDDLCKFLKENHHL